MISGKGGHMYKDVGVRSADFIYFFLNIPWKWNKLVSMRPNYLIFIGYLKTGGGEGGRANSWTPSGSATVFCPGFSSSWQHMHAMLCDGGVSWLWEKVLVESCAIPCDVVSVLCIILFILDNQSVRLDKWRQPFFASKLRDNQSGPKSTIDANTWLEEYSFINVTNTFDIVSFFSHKNLNEASSYILL